MVNEPACAEAVTLARENPGLGVGLHIALLCGRSALPPDKIPASSMRKRLRQQSGVRRLPLFLSKRIARAVAGGNPRPICQVSGTGLPLDHVNGHLHLHLHPVIFPMIMEEVEKSASATCA